MNTMVPCNISIPRRVWWGIVALWLFSLNSACFDVPCINDTRCPSDTPRCVRGICQFSEITSDGGSERDTEPFDPLRCVTGAKRPCYPTNTQGCRLHEDLSYTCQSPCRTGYEACVHGRWSGSCQDFVAPSHERCNAQDDDCDGHIDNGFPDLGQPCALGIGECRVVGKMICSADGSGTTCQSTSRQPATELCNGKDDDCDGYIDNQPPHPNQTLRRICYSGDPTTRNKGLCKDGYQLCKNGVWETSCHDEITPQQETCDGKDNDCDGWIDNTFVSLLAQPCVVGIGECQTQGHTVCNTEGTGVICHAKPLPPKPEICNNKDDDCNGKIDDNIPNCLQHCQTWGDCPAHNPHCQGGRCVRLCKRDADCDPTYVCKQGRCQSCPDGGSRNIDEECGDGKDNNCNGRIDEQCVSVVAGTPNPPYNSHKDGPGNQAVIYLPLGLTVDDKNNIYVADSAGYIRKVDVAGNVSTVFQNSSIPEPAGIAVDPFGNIYFATHYTKHIFKIDKQNQVSPFAKLPPSSDGLFSFMLGKMVCDAAGNLYVAGDALPQIFKIDPKGNLTILAGQSKVGYRDGPASQAMFYQPHDVALDAHGNVYVVELSGRRVRKIDKTGNVTTVAGTGQMGIKDGPGNQATFYSPQSLAIDRAGNLYVGDGHSYLRKIDTHGNVSTIIGNPLIFQVGPFSRAGIGQPFGIRFDSHGNLYVSSHTGHRILKIVF